MVLCPNAGNAAASDHRQLGIHVWGHTKDLVRFQQGTQQKNRVSKTDLSLVGAGQSRRASSKRKSR
jgi:hypothetical protein